MRVLSGTQPSHDHLHIGNYFGALRQQVALQHEYETLIFIADLHSMNSVRERFGISIGTPRSIGLKGSL